MKLHLTTRSFHLPEKVGENTFDQITIPVKDNVPKMIEVKITFDRKATRIDAKKNESQMRSVYTLTPLDSEEYKYLKEYLERSFQSYWKKKAGIASTVTQHNMLENEFDSHINEIRCCQVTQKLLDVIFQENSPIVQNKRKREDEVEEIEEIDSSEKRASSAKIAKLLDSPDISNNNTSQPAYFLRFMDSSVLKFTFEDPNRYIYASSCGVEQIKTLIFEYINYLTLINCLLQKRILNHHLDLPDQDKMIEEFSAKIEFLKKQKPLHPGVNIILSKTQLDFLANSIVYARVKELHQWASQDKNTLANFDSEKRDFSVISLNLFGRNLNFKCKTNEGMREYFYYPSMETVGESLIFDYETLKNYFHFCKELLQEKVLPLEVHRYCKSQMHLIGLIEEMDDSIQFLDELIDLPNQDPRSNSLFIMEDCFLFMMDDYVQKSFIEKFANDVNNAFTFIGLADVPAETQCVAPKEVEGELISQEFLQQMLASLKK